MALDLVIRGGTVVTAEKTFRADVGIQGEKIAEIAPSLSGARTIEAAGKLVMPGGVDSHCHVEQLSSTGKMCADDFYSATVAAAFGGTTTIIPFAAQHRGDSITAVVDDYREARRRKGGHRLRLPSHHRGSDAAGAGCGAAGMVKRGITSFKVYMTYELLRLNDEQMLDVLAAAERERALVMVHAENHEIIQWITRRLLERGHGAPKFHMTAHHPHRRSRGDQPRRRAVAPARRAGADRARLRPRGGADHPRGADAGRARARRNLPAVSVPQGQGRRQAGARGREVVLQPAAARRGLAGGGVGRA